MLAQIFASNVEVDTSFLVAVAVVFSGIGIGLFGWSLVTIVKLTQMVATLEEKVQQLADDIDDLTEGHPEFRRRPAR